MRRRIYAMIILLASSGLIGCSRTPQKFGASLTLGSSVTIKDLFMNKEGYVDKTVQLHGKIATECPTGCWFEVADESGIVFVELGTVENPIPQRVGRPVSVEGNIVLRAGQPVMQAAGIEIR